MVLVRDDFIIKPAPDQPALIGLDVRARISHGGEGQQDERGVLLLDPDGFRGDSRTAFLGDVGIARRRTERDVRDVDDRVAEALPHISGFEHQHAFVGAEENHPVRGHEIAAVGEMPSDDIVCLHVDLAYAFLLGIELGQAYRGGDPEASVAVFRDAAGAVGREPRGFIEILDVDVFTVSGNVDPADAGGIGRAPDGPA